ncbi:hypothetical protein PsorP6_017541 [Peronosclerospora sorghi]|uniref:Uncharacterized protein n=1 Tax=Peronosclerospora sorghi TaxID=230839 RepID=A0ACC0WNB1_9STRA|nr:hypothetical protein PsorP6_017541 [Peronosclerospora sorghi]
MNILAPPLQLAYASLEQARAAIDAHVEGEGYVVVVKRTTRVGNRKDGEVKALMLRPTESAYCLNTSWQFQRLVSAILCKFKREEGHRGQQGDFHRSLSTLPLI